MKNPSYLHSNDAASQTNLNMLPLSGMLVRANESLVMERVHQQELVTFSPAAKQRSRLNTEETVRETDTEPKISVTSGLTSA